jgi:hypothetical protein
MWGQVNDTDGITRVQELEGDTCKEVLKGRSLERFQDTFESAWEILENLLERQPYLNRRAQVGSVPSQSEAEKNQSHVNRKGKHGFFRGLLDLNYSNAIDIFKSLAESEPISGGSY